MTTLEKRRLLEIIKACRETGTRCDNNALLAGTWVQESFFGIAERLTELIGNEPK